MRLRISLVVGCKILKYYLEIFDKSCSFKKILNGGMLKVILND